MLFKAFFSGQCRRSTSLGVVAAIILGAVLPSQNRSAVEALGPESAPLWMRYPAISPDGKTIAFSFEGHLFVVPSTGGLAQPLTAGTAVDTSPVWSPDGKSIAFASDRYGNFDVFIMPSTGGEAKRLTYHSTREVPSSFTADDKAVIFKDRKSTRLNSSHRSLSRMPSSA